MSNDSNCEVKVKKSCRYEYQNATENKYQIQQIWNSFQNGGYRLKERHESINRFICVRACHNFSHIMLQPDHIFSTVNTQRITADSMTASRKKQLVYLSPFRVEGALSQASFYSSSHTFNGLFVSTWPKEEILASPLNDNTHNFSSSGLSVINT